jgi:ferredoxin
MSERLLPPPEVDSRKCVSYGLCHDHAAKYLEMDDEGITRVKPDVAGVAEYDADSVEAAMHACPALAITWPAHDRA